MPPYVPIEYPKWVGGVLVHDAAEELALRAAREDASPAGTVQAAPPPPETTTAEQMHIDAPRARLVALLALRAAPSPVARAEKRAQPPSPAAIRMRRTRERRREGKQSARWDISTAQIETLVAAGFLDPAKRDDAAEWARGFERVLDHLALSVQGATLPEHRCVGADGP